MTKLYSLARATMRSVALRWSMNGQGLTGSLPRMMLSVTVKTGMSMKCCAHTDSVADGVLGVANGHEFVIDEYLAAVREIIP